MMANIVTANSKRRAILDRGPIALPIEVITTWRPVKKRRKNVVINYSNVSCSIYIFIHGSSICIFEKKENIGSCIDKITLSLQKRKLSEYD